MCLLLYYYYYYYYYLKMFDFFQGLFEWLRQKIEKVIGSNVYERRFS